MNLGNIQFFEPHWLWLAASGPVMLAWLHLHAARERRKQLLRMASPQCLERLTSSHSQGRRRLKESLLVLALAFAGLALARPQWGSVERLGALAGEDIVFALDCSQSMTATDVAPNRMQRARLAIMDFVKRQRHGRVGLVVFSGSAFLQCPLTFDMEAFEEALLSVDEKTIAIPGTDIGRALSEAGRAMETNARRKLVIMLTDGEDLEKSGIAAAKRLAAGGMVVFTVGVGTVSGKEISTLNGAGQMELLRDSKGDTVRSRLDEDTLRAIANACGGSYLRLGSLDAGLAPLQTGIRQSTAVTGGQNSSRHGVDRFYVPLAILLILAGLEPLIGTRKRKAGTGMKILSACLFAGISLSIQASETNTPAPVIARDFFNAGNRALSTRKFPEAERMFRSALAAQDARVREPALFNLGHARFLGGQESLQKGPDAQKTGGQARSALETGHAAIEAAGNALAENRLDGLISAYIAGRGAQRNLRAAEKSVRAAIESHGGTLQKWQRAAEDFHSLTEINPALTNAAFNEEIVQKHIAKLVDSLRKMQQMAGKIGDQKQQLGEQLKKIKGLIPAPDAPPGPAGEDEEDEEGGDGREVKPESLTGQEESRGRQNETLSGKPTPDQAAHALDALQVDGNKRLPMGGNQEARPPKDKPGRNW